VNLAIENRSAVGAVGLLVTIGALAVASGSTEALVGLVLVPIWLFFPVVFTIAAAFVLLATLVTSVTVIDVAFVGLGVILVLAGRTSELERAGTLLSTTVFVAAVCFLVVALVLSLDRALWIAAGVLLVALVTAAYGVHRYELVSLGLVTDS
jgi:hypothetical protein